MDRTAGDGRGVLVNVALVWPGFRAWGLAQPGVDAATENAAPGSGPRSAVRCMGRQRRG